MLRFKTAAVTAPLLLGMVAWLSAAGIAYADTSPSVCTSDSGAGLCISQHPGSGTIVSEPEANGAANQNITFVWLGTVDAIKPFNDGQWNTKFSGDTVVEMGFTVYDNCGDNSNEVTQGILVPGSCDGVVIMGGQEVSPSLFVENGNRLVDVDQTNNTDVPQYLVRLRLGPPSSMVLLA
jgi:hypothetical protein